MAYLLHHARSGAMRRTVLMSTERVSDISTLCMRTKAINLFDARDLANRQRIGRLCALKQDVLMVFAVFRKCVTSVLSLQREK